MLLLYCGHRLNVKYFTTAQRIRKADSITEPIWFIMSICNHVIAYYS